MESLYKKSCEEFTQLTYSKAPAPGGGSVAALAGSLGAALGGMVCSLTTGKKKYAAYEEDIRRLLGETERLRQEFLFIMDEDVNNFLPLSKAYGLPAETEEQKEYKAQELDRCLKLAAEAPLRMVRTVCDALPIYEELTVKGSKLALSDVGCGVALLKAALDAAWLNVKINVGMIRDESFTSRIQRETLPMLEQGRAKCDEIYRAVEERL